MHGCLRCNDSGFESCFECFGFGQLSCGCGGEPDCPSCQGANRRDCPECCGSGRRECQLCRGHEKAVTVAPPGGREHLHVVHSPGDGSP